HCGRGGQDTSRCSGARTGSRPAPGLAGCRLFPCGEDVAGRQNQRGQPCKREFFHVLPPSSPKLQKTSDSLCFLYQLPALRNLILVIGEWKQQDEGLSEEQVLGKSRTEDLGPGAWTRDSLPMLASTAHWFPSVLRPQSFVLLLPVTASLVAKRPILHPIRYHGPRPDGRALQVRTVRRLRHTDSDAVLVPAFDLAFHPTRQRRRLAGQPSADCRPRHLEHLVHLLLRGLAARLHDADPLAHVLHPRPFVAIPVRPGIDAPALAQVGLEPAFVALARPTGARTPGVDSEAVAAVVLEHALVAVAPRPGLHPAAFLQPIAEPAPVFRDALRISFAVGQAVATSALVEALKLRVRDAAFAGRGGERYRKKEEETRSNHSVVNLEHRAPCFLAPSTWLFLVLPITSHRFPASHQSRITNHGIIRNGTPRRPNRNRCPWYRSSYPLQRCYTAVLRRARRTTSSSRSSPPRPRSQTSLFPKRSRRRL